VKLDVRRACGLIRVPEAAGYKQSRRRRPGLEEQILKAGPSGGMRLRDAIISVVAGAFAFRLQFEMVLQVATDAGEVMDHGDVGGAQGVRRFDSGKLQHAWRPNGAAGQDHLAIGAQRLRSRAMASDGFAAADVGSNEASTTK